MSLLDPFRIAGADNPLPQTSADEWNGLLTAIETGAPLTPYYLSGADRAVTFNISMWNAFLDALGPGFDGTPFRLSGTSGAQQITKDSFNDFLTALEETYAVIPSYSGPIANNFRMPDWLIGNVPGAIDRVWSRSSHFTSQAIDGAAKIGLAPFFVNLNTGDLAEHSGDGATTWTLVNSRQTLTIEYPEGTVHTVATLGGDEAFIVEPGAVVELDATLDIPSGAQFWVQRSFENEDASAPVKLPINFYGGNGDFAVHGNALDNAHISDGAVDPHSLYAFVDSFNVFCAPPAYIRASTTKRTFAFVGNSRTLGSFDLMASNTYGDMGQMARAFSEQGLAYVNMGYGNDTISEWLASHTFRLPILEHVTDVIVGDPTNDFGRVGHSAAQTIADYEAFAALVLAAFPTKRIYAITTPPIATTSTDSFATLVNQTVDNSFNDKLIIYNAAVRAGLEGYTGYFEVGDVLATARDNGIWKLVDGLASTADGVHELPRGNQEIADSGVFDLVVPTVTLVDLGGTFTLAEDATAGALAGTLTGMAEGSSLSITDTAGGRVALSGTTIIRGATELDFETHATHSFTIRENRADASNRPHDTVLTLNVTDVTIGPELITGTNSANLSGVASGTDAYQHVIGGLSTANTYRVSFTVSNYVGGSIFLRFGNNGVNSQGPIVANGSYSYDIQPGSVATQDITLRTFGLTTLDATVISAMRLY